MLNFHRIPIYSPLLIILCITFSLGGFSTTLAQPDEKADTSLQPQDTPKQAQIYRDNKDYTHAEQLYKKITKDYPGTDQALEAQKNLTTLYIVWGKQQEAQTAYQELRDKFSNHKNIETAVCQVADQYWDLHWYEGNSEKARRIYQDVVNNWPKSQSAMWAQSGLVRINIILKENSKDTQLLLNKLLTDYKDYESIEDVVCKIADEYRYLGKYEDAKQLYKYTKEHWPKNNDILWAHWGIIMSDIALGNNPLATGSIDKFIKDFSSHPRIVDGVWYIADEYRQKGNNDKSQEVLKKLSLYLSGDSSSPLPDTLYWTAEKYRWLYKYDDAKNIYQKIVQNYPNSSYAGKAKLGIARTEVSSLIASGKYAKAKEALEKLITDFPQDPDLPDVLYWLAERYRWSGNYEEAKRIYQQVMQKYSDSSYASSATLGSSGVDIISLITSQKYDQAEKSLDKLMADFPGNPNLAEVLRDIGLSYYSKARSKNLEGDVKGGKELYRKAIAVGERLVHEFPDSEVIPNIYYSSAVCYAQELGEYQKGIDYFQKIVDNYPNYQYAWHAQYAVGEYYEKLMNSGVIPESEALPKIEKAYTVVVEKYPDCEMAENALLSLGQINFDNSKFFEATMYFEMLLEKKPQEICNISADLIKAYEKMGNTEKVSVINNKVEKNCPK